MQISNGVILSSPVSDTGNPIETFDWSVCQCGGKLQAENRRLERRVDDLGHKANVNVVEVNRIYAVSESKELLATINEQKIISRHREVDLKSSHFSEDCARTKKANLKEHECGESNRKYIQKNDILKNWLTNGEFH
ncbi:hypothetical protein F5Y06DRAFT_299098 [Hypoxylon sp. FL0890]|nr:hypothetical protein F5Y06DRAFT_299098 [Hypoxylon sp. FL0890]